MKSILVPLGSSNRAINTLQYAIDFAAVTGGKVYVVQTFEAPKVTGSLKNINKVLEKKVRLELAQIMERVDTKGVDVIKCTLKGGIIDSVSVLEKELKIDLIIASAKPVSRDSDLYLGPLTGSFVKRTEIPMIIIPKGYQFKPYKRVMLGLRSGLLKHDHILDPLTTIIDLFKASVTLVHIITPKNLPEDNELHPDFKAIANEIIDTENATVFQGVLEYLKQVNPDVLCVIRNKRGFLTRLLEQNSIKKIDFESRIPLLVLKGNL
tara:strand:- start:5775 stop:6569 length:795 start_codon:yes stop_codon:yes gene_type:complete